MEDFKNIPITSIPAPVLVGSKVVGPRGGQAVVIDHFETGEIKIRYASVPTPQTLPAKKFRVFEAGPLLLDWLESRKKQAGECGGDEGQPEQPPEEQDSSEQEQQSAQTRSASENPLVAEMAKALAAKFIPEADREAVIDAAVKKSAAAITEAVNALPREQKISVSVKVPGKPDHEVPGAAHSQLPALIKMLAANVPVMMVGPAGSGKSHAAHQAATALGLRFFAQSVCAQTTESRLLGYMDAVGNYVRSLFREAYESGGVFLLDEIDAGNPNVLAALNSALSNGTCAFPDRMVQRHDEFRAVATANTWGQGATVEYIGRQPLDAATLDRFISLRWNYDDNLESALCNNAEWLGFVRAVRAEIEARGIKHVVSPRASIYGARLLEAGLIRKQVEQVALFKGMEEGSANAIQRKVSKNT